MAESIRIELEELEAVGRVTASDQRPVHTEFGFTAMQRDDSARRDDHAAPNLAENLDSAFSRLKARVVTE